MTPVHEHELSKNLTSLENLGFRWITDPKEALKIKDRDNYIFFGQYIHPSTFQPFVAGIEKRELEPCDKFLITLEVAKKTKNV